MECNIKCVKARRILDSRGFPTVECEVTLESGHTGRASVPSGASTGEFEAIELRDGGKDFMGKDVMKAVDNVNTLIAPTLVGRCALSQQEIDSLMIKLDGTDNKRKLGANATLSASLAVASAAAEYLGIPLFRYLGTPMSSRLPVPMMNILNGGAHASNNIDIQEFMIMPVGAGSFSQGIKWCCEVYHSLKNILNNLQKSVAVGDEGGFAPDLESDEQAIELIIKAIGAAGYNTKDIRIALDAAASEWYRGDGVYKLPKRSITMTSDELIQYFGSLCDKYPIISIEDPLSENDWQGFRAITDALGSRVQLVGDDLFVTNEERLSKGIESGCANAILIKVNQIGTLTETMRAIELAHRNGYKAVISHRSGETEDTSIADIAVATCSGQIKTGAPARAERTAKYNRLIRIEEELSDSAVYGII